MRSAHRGQLDARVRRGQDDDPYHGHDRHDRHDRHDCHDLQQGGGGRTLECLCPGQCLTKLQDCKIVQN